MRKAVWSVLAISGLLLVLGADAGAQRANSVRVGELLPAAPLKRGLPVRLSVRVDVELHSVRSGVVEFAVNASHPKRWVLLDSAVVDSGGSVATLTARVVPVDWAQDGAFSLLIVLRERRADGRRVALASYRRVLDVIP